MNATNAKTLHWPLAGLRFLVVDSNDFQRWQTTTALEGFGAHQVLQAADGKSALEIFRTIGTPIDVVVSDLALPGIDGLELLRHVGKSGSRTSAIIISSAPPALIGSVEAMARAYGIEVLCSIAKPLTAQSLHRSLSQLEYHSRPDPAARPALPKFSLTEMIAGLANDEFEPFFQPQVDLATGRIRGAEALARWRHPRHGLLPAHIPPHAFIAPFEASGHLERLTWIMLEKAAAGCRSWRRAGLDASVSVNLGAQPLADVTFAGRLDALVREHDLSPAHVVLELTESASITHVGDALENLSRLRLKGFGLSIDDYGIGYSSPQQLTRVAFTELKIDQSFVRGATTSASNRVVLEASLEIARKLGIVAVAEGVETKADWDILQEIGCDLAQGYLVALPMPLEGFMEWARGNQ